MESSSFKYLVTFLLIITSHLMCPISASRDPVSKSNIEFIRTSCVSTTYPKLCFRSLSSHASTIQSSPQLLASTALSVTLSAAKTTSDAMSKLSLSRRGLNPREVEAMKDCIEELKDSVDELKRSMGEMNQLVKSKANFKLLINDIQTWVSAALTDDNTCTDGFEEKSMNGNLKIAVRGKIVNVAQLTSNALALINKYALIHG